MTQCHGNSYGRPLEREIAQLLLGGATCAHAGLHTFLPSALLLATVHKQGPRTRPTRLP